MIISTYNISAVHLMGIAFNRHLSEGVYSNSLPRISVFFIVMETEIWKPVVGYEWKYEISSIGRIKSLNYHKEVTISILKTWRNKWWHSNITLCLLGIKKSFNVSRLVAEAFIPNHDNLPCVLHKIETLNENWLLYNWKDNLWWGTHTDNMRDMFKKWRANNYFQLNNPCTNLWKFWWKSHWAVKIIQLTMNLEFIREWDSQIEASNTLKIHKQSIYLCCKWKIRSAGWFIFKYS